MKVSYPKLVHNYDRYEQWCAVLNKWARHALKLIDFCSESNCNEYIEEVCMYIVKLDVLTN